ncbi:MAG: copper-translocating P-type ATPase [Anaerolineaceae bacterium]|nr:copper-translocating P-type ATPase [Anaerolineaceae bacterium]
MYARREPIERPNIMEHGHTHEKQPDRHQAEKLVHVEEQTSDQATHDAHANHNEHDHAHDTRVDHSEHQHGHGAHTDHTGHEMMFRNRFWVSLVLTVPVLLFSPMIQEWFGFTSPEFPGSGLIGPAFAIAIFAYGGIPFLQMAVPEVQNRKPGMMTLISLAITVAFAYSLFAAVTGSSMGFFWEMATLIDIMLLGHWMEMRSVRQASGALNELAKLMPDTAERLTENGITEEVRVTELHTGDMVLVRPGASVPADGEIIDGHSDLNEAMITGESKPVEKKEGDKVIAGTINGDGSLRVRVSATGDETALAGIMRLVEEAQSSKSNTQILADKAAGWLFYIALAVAILTAVLWVAAVGLQLEVLERVVTVLVIACPHALGLAIPLVVAISTSMGARNGILVRNRLALEEARQINTIIFDKTGTLTEGHFGVVNMTVAEGWQEDQALALALAVEGDSEHPIARGIRQKAETAEVKPVAITEFEVIKGRGIKAQYDGKSVHVGGPRLLELLEIELAGNLDNFRQTANDSAQTVVYMVVENQIVAAFALADVIRPESRQAIQRLHEMGVEVAMLTGDSQQVADAVARELGIDRVFAEVLPEHKDQKVAELQKQGKKVAMVGDGVNDAPALTRADIGIAIGSGTDVAIEAAGIILVRSNPLDVVKIFELSRATYRKMIQNLIWATGYNVVALPLAAGIFAPVGFILSPAVGAVFMSLSTIVVAINAQFLRRTNLAG